MSKLSNHWELTMSSYIPYMNWVENISGKTDQWGTSYHNHAQSELHIITEGSCKLFVDDTIVDLKKDQGIIISSAVMHGPKSVEHPFRRFNLLFMLQPGVEENIWNAVPVSYFVFDLDDEMKQSLCRIEQELPQTNRLFHEERMSVLFSDLAIQVLRNLSSFCMDLQQDTTAPPNRSWFEDMPIVDHFFSVVPVEMQTKAELARRLHCSERQLLRKLQSYYGLSFREKQIFSRIEHAKHLLRNTDMDIGDISAAVGYSDSTAFYRSFKHYAGITPSAYRKSLETK